MSSKRQQTMAKVARERTVREKRQRKLDKKQAKKVAAEGGMTMEEDAVIDVRPDLNARYVDGGPPEPTDGAVLVSSDAEPVADAK